MSKVELEFEPKIYVVGRQYIDDVSVAHFLAARNTSWRREDTLDVWAESQDALDLMELGGRVCFDDKTEVLTQHGWRLLSQLTGQEQVLTLSPDTHYVEYQPLLALHAYEYAGDLYCADSRDISFAVTPEHRQYGRFGMNESDQFVRTDQIAGRQFRVKLVGNGWIGTRPRSIELPAYEVEQKIVNQTGINYGTRTQLIAPSRSFAGDDIVPLALLLTYYATEGSLNSNGRGIAVYGDHQAEVTDLCQKLSLTCATYIDSRNKVPCMHIGGGAQFQQFVQESCGKLSANKKLPEWVLNLPREDLERVWKTLVITDGHTYKSGREILVTTSLILAGQAQEVLCKLGYSSAVRKMGNGKNHPLYAVSKKKRHESVLNRHAIIQKTSYNGKVYCVTTANGIVYVRRNGLPHFSGNCYMSFGKAQSGRTNTEYLQNIIESSHGSVLEHSTWTLVLAGISRSMAQELLRHRVGLSPSMLSQRYFDESDAHFVPPPLYLEPGNEELRNRWLEAMHQALAAYQELADLGAKALTQSRPGISKRDLRIQAREAARSVLPNSTETVIQITINGRALRHIMEMRGSEHAEREIRRWAVALAKIMKAEAPALFADVEVVQLANGTEALSVTHHKA